MAQAAYPRKYFPQNVLNWQSVDDFPGRSSRFWRVMNSLTKSLDFPDFPEDEIGIGSPGELLRLFIVLQRFLDRVFQTRDAF